MKSSQRVSLIATGLAVALIALTSGPASAGRESECARYAREQTAHLEGREIDIAIGAGVGAWAGQAILSGATGGISTGVAALIGGGAGAAWGYHHGRSYFHHYRSAYYSCMRG